jgi:hypothetical protein
LLTAVVSTSAKTAAENDGIQNPSLPPAVSITLTAIFRVVPAYFLLIMSLSSLGMSRNDIMDQLVLLSTLRNGWGCASNTDYFAHLSTLQ